MIFLLLVGFLAFGSFDASYAKTENIVVIGLNYPATGPYRAEGVQQKHGAELAVDEINSIGGILGHSVKMVEWDSKSDPNVTTNNVTGMIADQGVKMVFGGSSSATAIAAAEVCQKESVPFFATLAYAREVTGLNAHRYSFRECYNSDMGVKTLAPYMRDNWPAGTNRYFYITAGYVWGNSTEEIIRTATGTEDPTVHRGIKTPFPLTYSDLFTAMTEAAQAKPDVLVLVLFGNELAMALKLAVFLNIKETTNLVAPSITLEIAKTAGPQAIEGVISTTPWLWEATYKYNYLQGQNFVERFFNRYGTYPGTSAASAYTIVYEYQAAVERAGTFDGAAVVRELEGHKYELLKDQQLWRDFDHQSIQTVYLVKGKYQERAMSRNQEPSYFEILGKVAGNSVALSREEWNAERIKYKKPVRLESLIRKNTGLSN